MITQEVVQDRVKLISKALVRPIAAPRGMKMAEAQEYLSRFSDDDFALFVDKLGKSPQLHAVFSIDKMLRDDMVATLMSGGKALQHAISKYYKINVMVVKR